jgi:hypothetical protein
MDVLEDKLLFGSDIACSLQKTISGSSLGETFKQKNYRCYVNAMHGYTHNWACQRDNHPIIIKGLGLEDLETLERIFSASNVVAAITRYATPYCHCVFIDMFFKQWDEEKYSNLATMLYNNYIQALNIITTNSVVLQDALQSLDITEMDLAQWEIEQNEYFWTLSEEREWDIHTVAYVELLQKLHHTQ